MQTYWTAHDLAKRGHDVHVVTNADEVEFGFRQLFWDGDHGQLSAAYAHGSVTVHSTTPLRRFSYVPWSSPFSSQLFGLALGVMRSYDCDLIVGWYFEPYGITAAHIAKTFSKPLVLRHAGSDIGRLSKHPQLFETYRWMLQQASFVLTTVGSKTVVAQLEQLGAKRTQMRSIRSRALPSVYTRWTEPISIQSFATQSQQWLDTLFKGDRLAESIREMNAKNFDTNRPTIGFYGKVGEVKGSFDLLVALEKLADEGIEFNFLTIAGGTTKTHAAYSRAILNSELLSRCSWLFPFIAPWRIPSFLRRCDIACFLEREFPIEFHGSSIPREILAAGCCLVCSEEMARKQPFRSNLVDGKNYIVIRDPRDVDELAASLRNILTGDNNREIIAAHGKFLSKFWEQQCPAFGGMAEAIERIGLENFPAAELGCGLN